MTKEQEEAIKYLEFMNGTLDFNKMGYVYAKESIKTILNLIETQKQEIKKMLNFTTEGTSLRINNEVSKLLLKYIKELEQKSEKLDKVTDKLKEMNSKYTKEYKNVENLYLIEQDVSILQELSCVLDDVEEILNIIEGDKK